MSSHVFHKDVPCSVGELQNIITAPAGGLTLLPSSDYDEICQGIYIGDGDSAVSVGRMKKLGITHVLNAAQGKSPFHVHTSHVTYKRAKIKFLGVKATDFMNFVLTPYFQPAADFIEDAVCNGGQVFVHCVQGVSRSATLVVAYLMLNRHMPAQEALRMVRAKREVNPNEGFLQQLCDLNEKLKKAGHFNQPDKGSQAVSSEEAYLMHKPAGQQSCEDVEDVVTEVTGLDIASGGKDKVQSTVASNSDMISVASSLNKASAGSCTTSDGICGAVNEASSSNKLSAGMNTRSDSDENPCTVEDLEEILTAPSGGCMMLPSKAYDQIDNFIFIGEGGFARNIVGLQRLGITHVLNSAHKKGVNSDPQALYKAGMELLTVEAEDRVGFDLSPFFELAAEFIQSAIIAKGKVFVHCVAGASRSATLVLVFLMLRRHMTVREAMRMVREKREICPNSHFLQQLCDLDLHLRSQGHYEADLRKKFYAPS